MEDGMQKISSNFKHNPTPVAISQQGGLNSESLGLVLKKISQG